VAVEHKLDSVMDFDKVVVLEGGSLAEFGEPEVLRVREGGVFKGMWDSQR